MRHAYLILAHNQPELLKILISLLDVEENDIIVHLDKKSSLKENDFVQYAKKAKLCFIERIHIEWGSYRLIEAEIQLLKQALKLGKHCHYHLLSGTDLPIKPITTINSFYEEYSDKEFIHYWSTKKAEDEYKKRIGYKSYFRHMCGKTHNFWLVFNKIGLIIQKIFHLYDDCLEENICIGSQFFDITENLANDIVKNEKQILTLYKYASCGDECFLQTFVYNSEHWKNVWKPYFENDMIGNMRFIDFSNEKDGSPSTLEMKDLERLLNSNLNFARKFDAVNHKDLVESLLSNLE